MLLKGAIVMALQFWEEIKKNAKEAADITVKKTSEMTAIAKATVAIKNEEGKLSSCYKEIGRLFYTAERDGVDHTDEIATFIMQADKIKAAIAGYQKEIAALKKVSICEACGSEIPVDAQFCPSCGAKIVKPESAKEEEPCHCCCCDTEADAPCTCDDTAETTCTCEESCSCDAEAEAEEKTECPCCCCEAAEEAAPADTTATECPPVAVTEEKVESAHCCCCDTAETYETPAPADTAEEKTEE